ncbi:MAG: hypothetical protein ACFFKA_04425 [Candidatus Thorarchaeota archaeon]
MIYEDCIHYNESYCTSNKEEARLYFQQNGECWIFAKDSHPDRGCYQEK